MNREKKYRVASLVIKTAVAAFAFGYIVFKLYSYRDHFDVLAASVSGSSFFLWAIILLLGAVNWMLEAQKWRVLAATLQKISFGASLRAVLAGVALGIATPNRTGEFLSRVFSLRSGSRGEALVLAAVGSFAQFLVSVLAGIVGYYFLRKSVELSLFRDEFWLWMILLVLLALVLVFLILLFVETARVIIFNIPGLQRLKKYVDILSSLDPRGHLAVFFLSLMRYCAYATQFVLLMRICGISPEPVEAYAMVAVTYFAVTVIPTFALSEVAVRGSAAMALIGEPMHNTTGALAASLLIWVINIVLPAVAGLFFLYRLKIFGKQEDDENTA